MKYLVVLLLLSGCGNENACEKQAGPQPDPAAPYFGLVGAVIMLSDPEFVAWQRKVDQCKATYQAER